MADRVQITCKALSKSFAKTSVLKDCSALFESGEQTLLMGANGSGKSTLLRILAKLLRADKGEVSYTPDFNHKTLGYMGHQTMLYSQLSVKENLSLFQKLLGAEESIGEVMSRWNISQFSDKVLSSLSQGSKARVSLARTFLAKPQILLLDEPTAALDQASVEILEKEIKELFEFHEQNALLLCATHDLERVKSFANRIVLLHQGAIASDSKELDSASAQDEVIEHYRTFNR